VAIASNDWPYRGPTVARSRGVDEGDSPTAQWEAAHRTNRASGYLLGRHRAAILLTWSTRSRFGCCHSRGERDRPRHDVAGSVWRRHGEPRSSRRSVRTIVGNMSSPSASDTQGYPRSQAHDQARCRRVGATRGPPVAPDGASALECGRAPSTRWRRHWPTAESLTTNSNIRRMTDSRTSASAS